MSAIRSIAALIALSAPALAGGTLTPLGSPDLPIQILDHHVEVNITNGFARTEVRQTFHNPNDRDLEAIYRFPVPESASLSEMTIDAGELELNGEVVAKEEAERIYEEERDAGNDAGVASKESYLYYEFRVSPVPSHAESSFRFVYYQPLEIDTGVGRFVYPLESGGTDEVERAFWTTESDVQRSFSFHATVSSTWPVEALRTPGFSAMAVVESHHPELWEVTIDVPGGVGGATLDNDLVLYYRLAEGLPGRVEVIPFRDSLEGPGTFMAVVTPGIDLKPLESGSDYVFVVDTSGSMRGKLATLVDGVTRALGELNPKDRFRVIAFNDRTTDLTQGYQVATQANVDRAAQQLGRLAAGSGTDLYSPLKRAFADVDADRVTSLILVTDGVANSGALDPRRFEELMLTADIRVFGFLLGNGSNWPLMRLICDASGGFYKGISNADDILGQLLLAKSKITHESLHDAELHIEGGGTFETTAEFRGKVYRGEQLVMFGRYADPGPAELTLTARVSGSDKVYSTVFDFPAIDKDFPELERLWALDRIEEWQLHIDRDASIESEGIQAIADLGVAYQLVTDHTSMLVLGDASFEKHGIDRRNRERTGREREAQARRVGAAPRNFRVDAARQAFGSNAPSTRSSGALGPFAFLAGLPLMVLGMRRKRRVR